MHGLVISQLDDLFVGNVPGTQVTFEVRLEQLREERGVMVGWCELHQRPRSPSPGNRTIDVADGPERTSHDDSGNREDGASQRLNQFFERSSRCLVGYAHFVLSLLTVLHDVMLGHGVTLLPSK